MEILLVVPFALLWGILQEGKLLARIHFPDDPEEPSRIGHVPRNDRWALDVERFDLLLTPHRRRGNDSKNTGNTGNTASGIRDRMAVLNRDSPNAVTRAISAPSSKVPGSPL